MTKTDELIKELIKANPTINIVLDDCPLAPISPAILEDGRLEYQVSDGIMSRGMSYDAYTFANAKRYAKQMQDKVAKLKR